MLARAAMIEGWPWYNKTANQRSEMSKRFMIILALCIALFVGLIVFTGDDAGAPDDNQPVETSSHTQGEGIVTLVEYGDFQCPACGGYYPILQAVKAQYGDQLTFQFRHFPIVSIHPNAMSAHRAAEAAGRQDKFFEMHDMLYENQNAWTGSSNPAATFEGYAQSLDLDMEKYKADVASSNVLDVINKDITAGKDLDVQSTPAFFIDGKKIGENPRDVEGFSALIDEALKNKNQQ